jgi:carbon-monoxide dehydrogenase small subunit
MKQVSLTVNGRQVQALVEPRTHLADFLRDNQRLTGTHVACEHGVCGACTLLVDDQPVRSCIMYTVACEGRTVRSIEGFADDALMTRLREAFSSEHALQCGFCTPGMLVAARGICQRLSEPDEQRIRDELSGNLCRCTGYVGIVNAIKVVIAEKKREPAGLQAKPPQATPMPSFQPSAMLAQPGVVPAASANAADRKGATRIEKSFTLPYPPAAVWQVLGDLPIASACLPGAELLEHDDRSVKGRIRIKFGPMSAAFAGAASLEKNEAEMRTTIRGASTDSISNSRVRGELAYRLLPGEEGRATTVEVIVHYTLLGPLAQFSRSGLVQEFAGRLTQQFAHNLAERMSGASAGPLKAAEFKVGGMLFSILWHRIRSWFGARD